jgi:predicted transcriptional regulator of viral defense system
MTTETRSLSPRELALLEVWEADRRRVVTLDDIQAQCPELARSSVRALAARMRRKGFLSPLGRGVYAVLPVSAMGIDAPDIAAWIEALRHRSGLRFYVGFDSAAAHYGWYSEAYGRVTIGVIAGAVSRKSAPTGTSVRTVRALRLVGTEHIVEARWRDSRAPMSTPELTVLDVVRKPEFVDGVSGCLRVLDLAGRDRSVDRLLLARLALATSVRLRKRLGWLTERAGWTWNAQQLRLLRHGWPESHRATLGDSHAKGIPGSWDRRWRLLINVPDRELRPAVGVR